MPTVQSTAEINAPSDALFALAQDYDLRLEWDPFLSEMRFCGGATEPAVGVRVWVRARNGLSMEARYITLNPPEQVAIAMVEGPPVFRRFSGAWLFKALSPERTRVTFRYNFTARPRILGSVMAAVLQRDVAKRLAGLKASAETTDILKRLPRRCRAR
ncbi:polyketide cyclase [Sorangium cellulosum]|uniref:Polyketide cyclase n=1 Tax=Sorangium cellulosum TaxID=56 RepID=A0A4P2Q1L4_SORCE|nr:SRPBCC family protein [Sorangium cellulosum]AUX23100.1 polyketide cyclase [Sorangium cellulosum]